MSRLTRCLCDFEAPCEAGPPANPKRFMTPWKPFPIVIPATSTYCPATKCDAVILVPTGNKPSCEANRTRHTIMMHPKPQSLSFLFGGRCTQKLKESGTQVAIIALCTAASPTFDTLNSERCLLMGTPAALKCPRCAPLTCFPRLHPIPSCRPLYPFFAVVLTCVTCTHQPSKYLLHSSPIAPRYRGKISFPKSLHQQRGSAVNSMGDYAYAEHM